jgi:hypothetical protein
MALKGSGVADVDRIADELGAGARSADTVQAAAQSWVTTLTRAFPETVPLARIYAVLPNSRLTGTESRFLAQFMQKNRLGDKIDPGTLVLTLLGTSGVEDAWKDRERSQGHLAIPLLSGAFVEGAPMVARLLGDFGVGVSWIDSRDSAVVVKKLGSNLGTFYVRDASTEKDGQGRHVVPAQDFVKQYGVHTVFGFGGAYLDGTLVTLILFTRESLEPADVQRYMPFMSQFLGQTFAQVLSGKLLES